MDDLLERFLLALDALEGKGHVNLQRLVRDVPREAREAWRDAVMGGGLPPQTPQNDVERGAIVLGVDEALGNCVPERRMPSIPLPAGLAKLYENYLAHAWLWRSRTGDLLLPRRCKYGRPRSPETAVDLCVNVIRVSAEVADRVRLKWTPIGCDHPGDTDSALPIAATPFMGPGDLEIVGLQDAGVDYYQLRPRAEKLRPTVTHVLRKLADGSAALCLLPEGALNTDLLDHWVDSLMAYPERTKYLPTWILLGSGPFRPVNADIDDPPANRAVLLHAPTGTPLLEHDKQLPFRLTADQIQSWRLAHPPSTAELTGLGPGARDEFIRSGTGPVTVLESYAGRFAVLLCEDIGRIATQLTLDLVTVGVSHLLVPVFAKETRPRRWEENSAQAHALEGGASVAVVNSLVVPLLDENSDADETGFMLLVLPGKDNEWPVSRVISASAPSDVRFEAFAL